MPLRIPASLHTDLKRGAKEEGVSLNQYCLYLLARNLKHPEGQAGQKLSELLCFLEEARLLQKEMKNVPSSLPPRETPAERWKKLYGNH